MGGAAVMTTPWRFLSGSVAGAEHARKATGSEDSFAVSQGDHGVILAVADGGSRLPLSAVGSSLATSLAISRARSSLEGRAGDGWPRDASDWRSLAHGVLSDVMAAFTAAAANLSGALPGAQPGDLGTTLTLVIVAHPWLAVASIGDGFVVTRSSPDHFDLLLPPDAPGSPADVLSREPGRTTFLTTPGAADAARVVVARIPGLTGIAVSTDGLCELSLVYSAALAQHPHEGFFRPIFARAEAGEDAPALLRLLASEQVCALTTDDKTLVVGVR